jgi:hypothetical protein
MSWAEEYLAAAQVFDFSRDPDDYRRSVQSEVSIAGLLVPVNSEDMNLLDSLFVEYEGAFTFYRKHRDGRWLSPNLTGTMQAQMRRAATHAKEDSDFKYISLDPRDYSTFSCPDIGDLTVISIHTRPERCWFLGILRFEGALGLSLGRMRVMRPNENGMYPVTIRTKWRALTNKQKQEEVRDAYQRLIRA